jgi:hypothetical protein
VQACWLAGCCGGGRRVALPHQTTTRTSAAHRCSTYPTRLQACASRTACVSVMPKRRASEDAADQRPPRRTAVAAAAPACSVPGSVGCDTAAAAAVGDKQRVCLAVTGSVAAVKLPEITKKLLEHGFYVDVMLTRSAEFFQVQPRQRTSTGYVGALVP